MNIEAIKMAADLLMTAIVRALFFKSPSVSSISLTISTRDGEQ